MAARYENTIFIAAALLYTGTIHFQPYPFSFLLKAVPAATAAVACFRLLRGIDAVFMSAGFLFCMAGDIFLDIDGAGLFVQGLGSFLAAHLFFCVAFARRFKPGKSSGIKGACIIVYIGIMAVILIPGLGKMLLPVVLYILCIGAMGVSAALMAPGFSAVFTGACFFIFSDSVIAVTKFINPFVFSGYLVMATYYAGLFFIMRGITAPHRKNGDGVWSS